MLNSESKEVGETSILLCELEILIISWWGIIYGQEHEKY